ncbi:MAG: PDZ domain-containing protein [Spirochaetota bacterium]|nr:PDZ domain-containing protein [Spirochaetota bacterium]
MQNIKYHILNSISIILFSYIMAVTINQFIKHKFMPVYANPTNNNRSYTNTSTIKRFDEYKKILDSKFFKLAENVTTNDTFETETVSNPTDLRLLGTVSGIPQIARALIRKKSERESLVYKLWSDVYGYKLVRINNSQVYLKKEDKVVIIDMFEKDETTTKKSSEKPEVGRLSRDSGSTRNSRTISRAEIQQKILNNIDNALKGLRAGPYRVNGKIEGYKLFRVRPNNILYKLGAKSGDIIKRINGHPLDSTEKLVSMWSTLKDESKITIDLERRGKLQTFDFNITD